MKIAGIRKTSLIDYPGHIATVVFTQGCNFHCPYCHNAELISEDRDIEYMDMNYFWDFLDKRFDLLDGVVITGGEPTLQPDILEFAGKIKENNLKVKLDTNGSNFMVIKKLIDDGLVDYIAVDIKGIPDSYDEYSKSKSVVHSLEKLVQFILNNNINYEFRTTVVPGLHDKDDIEEIARFIIGAEKYVIQNFKPVSTYDSSFENKHPFPDSVLEKFKQTAENVLKNTEVVLRD